MALNYLQRMSGIATYTREVTKLLEGSSLTLLDTRKTTPNCRVFEKYAVRAGGGNNHRYNPVSYTHLARKDNTRTVYKIYILPAEITDSIYNLTGKRLADIWIHAFLLK